MNPKNPRQDAALSMIVLYVGGLAAQVQKNGVE
jgi:hypothetical protein